MGAWYNLGWAPGVPSDVAEALRLRQIRVMADMAVVSMVAQILAWAGALAFAAPASPSGAFLIACAAVGLGILVQIPATWANRRALARGSIGDADVSVSVLACLWIGLCYSTATFMLASPDHVDIRLLLTFLIAGICSAAVAWFSALPAAAVGLVAMMLAPSALRLLVSDAILSQITAGLIVVYAVMLAAFARQGFRLHVAGLKLEAENLRLLNEANAANRLKSEFLATISHEIRTPMSGILGMLQMMLSDPLTPEQARRARLALDSSESLLVVINDVLDWSRLERGALRLNLTPCHLGDLVEGVVALMRARAREKGLDLSVEFEPGAPLWIEADAARLRQMLLNLVGNAVKFTAIGGVRVRVLPGADAGDGDPRVRIEVVDTGIGIDPAVVGRLFQRFVQGDQTISRAFGGAGLGLAITRELAQLFGGEVGVVSDLGRGSTFWFEIPARPVTPASARVSRRDLGAPLGEGSGPGGADAEAPLDVLLVEDNEVNRIFLDQFLRRRGHRVRQASDGAEAITAAAAHRHDVILMDVQMPNVDGLAATRAIRALPAPHGSVPIIALTANTSAEDRERALAAGMDDHLAKPIELDRLVACLGRLKPLAAAPIPTPVETQDRAATGA